MLDRAILLVDERGVRRRLQGVLNKLDVFVESARTRQSLLSLVSREACELVFISSSVIEDSSQDLLSSIFELPEPPDVIVFVDREDPRQRAALLARGCTAVLYQDLPTASIRSVLEAVAARRNRRQPKTIDRIRTIGRPTLADFVSESKTMRAFMETVERVAPTNATLLILGETGVGKERLAQAIHGDSLRQAGPFVAVNCAALTESLLESELFGHEEGAFTGATRSRRGCFELAHKGTLFLDEIGEMPLHLQVKLLRALQEREVQRVGGERVIPVDVRVMAASNRDLQQDVDAGSFRKDLFYRLNVVSLTIPPLRERLEDIPELVAGYINYFSNQMPHRAVSVDAQAMQALKRYHWPGNVRELINIVERSLLLCAHEVIGLADLPIEIRSVVDDRAEPGDGVDGSCALAEGSLGNGASGNGVIGKLFESGYGDQPLNTLLETVERAYLTRLLKATQGKVGRVAERAAIDPRVLYEKMKRFQLNKDDFR